VIDDEDEDKIDSSWPDPEENRRPTVAPPPAAEPEPKTKPKRPTPPVLRLDSSSAFNRPDPSAVISRRSRANVLDMANDAHPDLAIAEPSEALDLVAREADRETPIAPTAPPSASALDRRAAAEQEHRGEAEDAGPVREMRERFSLGDYSGALVIAEEMLEDHPDHAEALKYADSCRQVLEQMYTARIGPLERVPFVAVPPEQLRWLNLDHRAGFVLSHIDGSCSLEQILDVSGMPTLDALRILFELLQQRVISFR
jgi:hypothetical protein